MPHAAGGYAHDRVASLASEVASKTAAASKRGAFGSASTRFANGGAGSSSGSGGPDAALASMIAGGAAVAAGDVIGPGRHHVDGSIAQKAAAAAVRASAVSWLVHFDQFS